MIAQASWAVERGEDGERFVVEGFRVWPVTVIIGLWLVGWLTGELAVLNALRGDFGVEKVFLLAWLTGWTAGGLVTGSLFLFSIAGRQVLILAPGRVRLRYEVSFLSWTHELSAVRGLCVNKAPIQGPTAFSALTFRHSAGWAFYGIGLNSEKAAELLQAIRARGALPAEAFVP